MLDQIKRWTRSSFPLIEDMIDFTFQRGMRSITGYPDRFDLVIVDVNNTLIDGSVEFEILKDKIGERSAHSVIQYLDYVKENGDLTVNKWFLASIQTISEKSKGITQADIAKTMQRLLDEGRINHDLIHNVLLPLKQNNTKILVMTKGSCSYAAEWIAKGYGFNKGYGHKLDGEHKVSELIGVKSERIRVDGSETVVKTKFDKAKEFCKEKGIAFDGSRVAFITDHVDSREMRGCVVILYKFDKERVKSQRRAAKLGTFHVMFEKDNQDEMFRFLSNPKIAKQFKQGRPRVFVGAN